MNVTEIFQNNNKKRIYARNSYKDIPNEEKIELVDIWKIIMKWERIIG